MSKTTTAQTNRRTLLIGAGVLGAAAGGAGLLLSRRHGFFWSRLFNPFSAAKFDLPPLPGLLDASGAQIPGFSAADIAGKTVFLNAFAGWCPNCRAEHAALMDFASSGGRIYGVATMEDPANTLEYLRKQGNPFVKVGVDRKGYLLHALGARGIPASFVMAPAPNIALKLEGTQSLADLTGKIAPLLG